MKRLTALILSLTLALSLTLGFAGSASAAEIELAEIYSSYGLGETIYVQGTTDLDLLMLYIIDPSDRVGFPVTLTREELEYGYDIRIGSSWELGFYTLVLGYGSVIMNEYHIEIVQDPVDHRPSRNPGTNSTTPVVATSISISPASLVLEVGESANVKVTSDSSVSWETDDDDLITIKGTKDAEITAKKTGTATAWAYSGNNYVTLKVQVVPATKKENDNNRQPTKPGTDGSGLVDEEPVVETPDAFSDIDGVKWAKESINALAADGVVKGIGDGTFDPERSVTRAEFVKMIVDAFDFEDAGDAAFDDINGDEWYADVVLIAANNGIVNGYNGLFSPLDNITCQDAALILSRVADMKGISLPQPPADENEADQYALDAVALLKGNKVITAEMSFSAHENASRAQSAYMIYNIYKQR